MGPTHASDYNVGIVRYEYNFPENVVITDKTRHATENVTRVYWEHLGKPIFDEAINKVEHAELSKYYITTHGHHQGMYMATQDLLRAWKDRKGCNFNVVKDRPGSKQQPSEGTQRVWMSSQQLFAVSLWRELLVAILSCILSFAILLQRNDTVLLRNCCQ